MVAYAIRIPLAAYLLRQSGVAQAIEQRFERISVSIRIHSDQFPR